MRRTSARSPSRLRTALLLAGTLAVVLLLARAAFARAGGGGGFGGGGGGGHGGGAGALVYIFIRLIQLAIADPPVGIPLLLAFCGFVYVSGKATNRARQTHTIRRGIVAQFVSRKKEISEAIHRTDPEFDPERFEERIRAAFLKVQQGWCEQRLELLRPFVSDGIHERFALQIEEQKDLGYRNLMESVSVRGVAFTEFEQEGPFEVLTVRIRAAAKDYRVSTDTGRRIFGSTAVEEFVEFWSFLRRRGAKTKKDANGLIEGRCPNCGAEIEMNQWATCRHCSSFLKSGEFDWVLVEITQASVYRPREHLPVPGMAGLEARDPGFSLSHLEDRASVLFWRYAMASRKGSTDLLRRVATPDLVKARETAFAEEKKFGPHRFFGERAVGSVETRGILQGEETDRAVVQVAWQGALFTEGKDGHPVRGPRGRTRWTLFVLSRKAGAATRTEAAVSSAHCPGCGAPEPNEETDKCEFCGALLFDGGLDWILSFAGSRNTPEGGKILEEIDALPAPSPGAPLPPAPAAAPAAAAAASAAPAPSSPPPDGRPLPEHAIAWLAKIAVADGSPDPRERARVESLARKAGMRPTAIHSLFSAAEHPHFEPSFPADPGEAHDWLAGMAEVALADGKITREEGRLLANAADAAGLPKAAARRIVNEERRRLTRHARAAIRRAK